MSDLEKFINNNRTEFDDVESPSFDGIWKGVNEEINVKKVGSFFRIRKSYLFGVAASVLLLIGFLGGALWQKTTYSPDEYSLSTISPELAKQETEFRELIAQKEAEIGLNQIEKTAFEDIFEELDLLEKIHQEYQKDIPAYSQNDQLVNTLIKYYEQKIRILERLSKEIEKLKYHEERNREKQL